MPTIKFTIKYPTPEKTLPLYGLVHARHAGPIEIPEVGIKIPNALVTDIDSIYSNEVDAFGKPVFCNITLTYEIIPKGE